MGLPDYQLHEMRTVLCCGCGVAFGLTAYLFDRRQVDQARFYCPNGHPQVFGESVDKRRIRDLEAQIQREQRQRVWAETRAKDAAVAARQARAQLGRLNRRIQHGVCPHCHRTFRQLAAHMKSKHPDTGSVPMAGGGES